MTHEIEELLAGKHNMKLRNITDALDIMTSGQPGCILTLDDLGDDFFDLKNGIAGEVFQKFIIYQYPIAIVLPSDHKLGDRVTELAREHSHHSQIRFCTTIEQAKQWMLGKIEHSGQP